MIATIIVALVTSLLTYLITSMHYHKKIKSLRFQIIDLIDDLADCKDRTFKWAFSRGWENGIKEGRILESRDRIVPGPLFPLD